MRKLMFFIFFSIGYLPSSVFGQVVEVAPINIIDDGGATAAQGILAFAGYPMLIDELEKLQVPLKAFVREFEKRALYYPGTLVMHNQNMIGKKVTAVEDRISDLSTDNMNLSFLYYSKRKENAKLLDAIKEEFEIIKAELSTSSTTVVMGEKLNLYQDVMMTLTRTNRQLDIVESNIGGSKHTKRVVEQYLPSPVSP